VPPSVRQTNFGGGELDPQLWGRTDLPQYGRGLRTMRNFFPSRQGAAVSRPGTTYVVGSKYVDSPSLGPDRDEGQARLIRFDSGDALYQSYALEFGNLYVRFITNGGQVESPPGTPYEVPTPYSNEDIWQLQTAQLGDELIICSPNHPPQRLRRNAHADWTVEAVRFKAYTPWPTDVGNPAAVTTGFCIVRPAFWEASHDYLLDDIIESGLYVYKCITPGTSAMGGGPITDSQDITDGTVHWKVIAGRNYPDVDHISREWQWLWTAVVKDNETGAVYETLGERVSFTFDGNDFDGSSHLILGDNWSVYQDMPIILRRDDTSALLSPPEGSDTYVVQEYLLYRGKGGAFGWVGSTKSREFVDVGEAPNYAIQPPVGTEPFSDPATPGGTGWPTACAFYQGRLFFMGPTNKPGDFFGSKVNDFQNWDVREYLEVEDEALHFELASRRREEIRSAAVLGKLVMPTSVSVWSADGGQGQPMAFDHIEARVEEEVGATHLPPLIVEGAMLYARAKGRGVRALAGQDQISSMQGVDISEHALHLFTGKDKSLVDWCYAEDPWGLVWAVRADGALLSLTFNRQNWAWARHDTDGVVESVCAIPEANEDAVYLVVVRDLGAAGKHRYIERMTSRVKYGGVVVNATPAVAQAPDFICLDSALQYFGVGGISTITGLGHLEGKEVWVLAQGSDPLGPLTVASGGIDLGDPLAANVDTGLGPRLVAYVGLLFTPELETLDVAGGEARLKKKTVERIGFEVDQSLGLQVGQDFDNLDEWVQRDVADGYNAISSATTLVDMPVDSTWDQSARAVLRQSMPLPVTVVGLTRELAFGE
jgi:hypothetical protein